jgi:hypothetical protein
MALPIPRLQPVTKAISPSSLNWSRMCISLCYLLLRSRIAHFRLPIADGHRKELPHHFFNRPAAAGQSAIGNDAAFILYTSESFLIPTNRH